MVLVLTVDGGDMLFSEQFACVHCNISLGEMEPRTFSFNNPHGACPACTGLGYKLEVDPELVIPNEELTLGEGAIQPWVRSGSSSPWFSSLLDSLSKEYGFSTKVPVKKLDPKYVELILYGNKGKPIRMKHRTQKGRTFEWDTTFEGVVNNLERRYRETDSDYMRSEIERYMTSRPCQSCDGQRLKPEALAVTVCGLNVMEVTAKSIAQALEWVRVIGGSRLDGNGASPNGPHAGTSLELASPDMEQASDNGREATDGLPEVAIERLSERDTAIASQVLKEIDARLRFLMGIGLDYLTLARGASTLSGGEAQRIRLATQIGSGLMGVLYVCDEPSVGLHPVDDSRLIETLKSLRDLGNTVLIVEHDEAIMRAADFVVDLGPGAGENGGHVVASGTVDEIAEVPESITGDYLSQRRRIPLPMARRPGNKLQTVVRGARANNLKSIDVHIPLGMLVCITGVSGSGKSTLINEVLYKRLAQQLYKAKDRPGESDGIEGTEHIDKVVNIDQSPIGRTPRSNPATYTGTFTPIRELFATVPEARMRGYKPGRFSFNVKGGRCEACSGDGYINIEMQFLPDVTVPCEVCEGRRYNREALEIRFKGKNIADVLSMTVSEALDFFSSIPKVRNKLQTMHDVGIGYIRLGQPATQLSGGEAQRIKLATELSKRATGRTLYILDEPTTGLSFEDCGHLLRVLHRLVDAGNTVILIEHHLDLIKNADWNHRPGARRRRAWRRGHCGGHARAGHGDGAFLHGPVPEGASRAPRAGDSVGGATGQASASARERLTLTSVSDFVESLDEPRSVRAHRTSP